MAVEDAKNLKPRPLFCRQLGYFGDGLNDVKNDGDSVLVRLANGSYICVSGKCFD